MNAVVSRLLLPFISILTVGLLLGLSPADAQTGADKKKKKKVEEKKVEEKKTEEKKTETKVEEKKPEPFVPDVPKVELKGHTSFVTGVLFSADGKGVISAGKDRTLRVWDLGAKKDVATFKGAGEFFALAVHKDQILSADGKFNKEKKAWEGEIKFWDGKSDKASKSIKGHEQTIQSVSISADGKYLVSASEDGTAKIWDLAAAKETQNLKGHTGTVYSAAFSSDGKHVATGSHDGSVKIWDAASGKELGAFKIEKTEKKVDDKTKKEIVTKIAGREFTHVAFTKDSKKVIAANLEGEIKILDLAGKQLQEFKVADGIWGFDVSKDGSKLAVGTWGKTIHILNVSDGKEVQLIKAHNGTVTSVAFSVDGKRLVSGGADGLIKIWDVK